jgi:anaerobic ribonucleoside-triphosphate reductase
MFGINELKKEVERLSERLDKKTEYLNYENQRLKDRLRELEYLFHNPSLYKTGDTLDGGVVVRYNIEPREYGFVKRYEVLKDNKIIIRYL